MDMLAYILATNALTSNIHWILGDVGMGNPSQLPFGYIASFSETVRWETAMGGTGGLAAGGKQGLDDWLAPIVLTVAHEPHRYVPPQTAQPPSTSALYPGNLGIAAGAMPYQEQPGWRKHLQTTQKLKGALRENIVIGGEAATTRITEARYVLQMVQNKLYRASRLTIQAQQRRVRGT